MKKAGMEEKKPLRYRWFHTGPYRCPQLAPHWTQKHLIEEYYARRKSSSERLVAFQMNWKGENFYTGNRVKVYVSTKNKDFENWLKKHRGERHFFVTEHSRFNKMSKRAKAASGEMKPFADTCNKSGPAGRISSRLLGGAGIVAFEDSPAAQPQCSP
jgi:hypothetical protein